MLATGEKVWELTTWKREIIEGIERTWSNSYCFLTATPFSYGTAQVVCHNMVAAEQFTYTGNVHIFGAVCWEWSSLERFAARSAVYVWPESRMGIYPMPEGGTVLPWEYALVWKKEAKGGRSGRMAFRRCLEDVRVVPYREEGFAIPNDKPWGIFHTDLVAYWFNNTPIPHAIVSREDELHPPTSAVPVVYMSVGHLTKLQSIADAQLRKTPKAKPYEEIWRASLPFAFAGVQEIYSLGLSHPDGMERDDVEKLRVMAGALKGAFVGIEPYWDKGIEPVLMLNWRPTSGLDPLSIQVQAIATDCIGAMDEFSDILADLESYPDERIPWIMLQPFLQAYSYYVLCLDRVGAMRWTGTPVKAVVV